VLVTSYELGVERWGGWAEYVRVPAEWVIPLPHGMTLEESMILGTAGLTAGLCVRALRQHEVQPDSGEVVVTGASGGVGSLAVKLLAQLGYRVVAVSGKRDHYEWLHGLGAAVCLGRDAMQGDPSKPLLSARWAGGVDTVGGETLASLLRSIKNEGCVACCGMAGGAELAMTVYPFILRGITLAGVDSAWCPMNRRQEVWNLLAGPWKPHSLASLGRTIGWDDIRQTTQEMLAGHSVGRSVVDVLR
jgi:putative YhdH/YhfP family quinone oxidoreductase